MMPSSEVKLHALLYTKGHYPENINTMKAICGAYCGITPDYIDENGLLHFWIMILEEFCPEAKMKDIIFNSFKDKWMYSNESNGFITRMDIINSIMSYLRYRNVSDLTLPQVNPEFFQLTNTPE